MSEPIVKGTISLYPIPSMLHMSVVNGALYRYFNNREDLSDIATRLQELLNSLKNERENNEIWQEVEKRINTYLGYSVNNLFRRSGRYGWQTGRLLEHEFAGLFQALCDMCLGQDTSRAEYTWTKDKKGKKKHRTIKNTAYTGNIKGTIQLDSDFDVDGIFNNIQNAWTRENIQMALQNSNITKNTMAGWVKPPEPKDIKTDVYGGGGGNISNTVILEWKEDKKLIDLLYILNNYKISLKNYSDLNNISLGKSTPFKAYAGVLQTLGYSDSVIRESYIRLQCCYINSISMTDNSSKHQNHQKYISTVMSKIKSVFELIGMGIVSVDGFQDNVQLFVVNQHNGDFIKVYDTTTLAKNFLKNNNFSITGSNPFAKQKITISVK